MEATEGRTHPQGPATPTSPRPRLPDFYIVGAQKAGTTTLGRMLQCHEHVFMSEPKEPFFFDQDEGVHGAFLAFCPEDVRSFDWAGRKDELLRGYGELFAAASGDHLCGEASTSYMASRKAPARMAEVTPDAKVVFMLRDPVERAYAAYWHHVRLGRVCGTFQQEVDNQSCLIVELGRYEEHLSRYVHHFGRERVHCCLFERFVAQPVSEYEALLRFLGLESPGGVEIPHENKGRYPHSVRLQLALNQLERLAGLYPYRPPRTAWRSGAGDSAARGSPLRLAKRAIQKLNLRRTEPPPMDAGIRASLEAFYRRENAGLADLLGLDVSEHWPFMAGG